MSKTSHDAVYEVFDHGSRASFMFPLFWLSFEGQLLAATEFSGPPGLDKHPLLLHSLGKVEICHFSQAS